MLQQGDWMIASNSWIWIITWFPLSVLCKRQSRWLFSLSQVFNDYSKLLRIFIMVHRCSLDFFSLFSRRNANSTFTFIVSALFLQSSSITRARGLWFWISACDLLCAFSTIATVILLLQQYNKQEGKIGQLHLTVFARFSQKPVSLILMKISFRNKRSNSLHEWVTESIIQLID